MHVYCQNPKSFKTHCYNDIIDNFIGQKPSPQNSASLGMPHFIVASAVFESIEQQVKIPNALYI